MADRSVLVRLRADISDFQRGMRTASAETALLERQLESVDKRGGAAIDRLSGRLRLFADAAAIFGPGTVPVGGVLTAGVAGFASQLGFAAVAGGVLAGSMQGLGDALSAMNKAQLEPTDANLEAAHDALKRLSPATRDLARELFALKPALVAIRDIGAESLAPGLSESLDSLEEVGPRVAGIFDAIATASGEIAADSAASLASDRWADFFTFLETEGPTALHELAAAVGDVTHGLAELWEAFAPLNSDFSGWLVDVADGFDGWASGLSQAEGFRNFIDYVRETGPQVADTAGALANAIVQIVQAAAPLGGPVLAAVEAFANGLAAIADSDLGTPIMVGVTALSLYNRTLAITQSLQKRVDGAGGGLFGAIGTRQNSVQASFAAVRKDVEALGSTWMTAGARTTREQERMATSAKSLRTNLGALTVEGAKAAAPVAGLAVVASGAADGLGLTNTASLALMGTMVGPWGTALGAGAGLLLDMKAASDQATASAENFRATIATLDVATLATGLQQLKELQQATGEDSLGAGLIGQMIGDTEAQIEKTKELEQVEATRSRASAMAYVSELGLNSQLSTWRTKSVEEIKAQADALAAVREEGSKVGQSFLTFDDSLSKAKATLGDFIGQMNETTDAMANFNTNSMKAAKKGIDEGLIASLRQLGPEGAVQLKNLANATEEQVDRANRAYRRQQRELERTIDVTARLAGYSPLEMKVNTNTSGAMRDIEGLEARLRAIKDETVFVNVRQIGSTTLGPRNEAADGATVPKTGLPYADRHLYLLADGEEVISNRRGQADRHRPLLKRINAGLADGGTTGKGKKVKREFENLGMVTTPGEIRKWLEAAERQEDAAARQAAAAAVAARAAQDQLEAAEKGAQTAEDNLRAIEQERDNFRAQVASQYNNSLTGRGLAGLTQTLARDTNASNSTNATLQALVAAGLDTTGAAAGLYKELAASDDQRTLNELLAAGPEYITMLEQQYAARDAANAARADSAASNSFSAAVTAAQQTLDVANAQLAQAQAAASAADQRSQAMRDQVTQLQGQVSRLAGQFADAINSTVRGMRR